VTGKVIATVREEPMEFISFEDTSALYETTFFPKAYARFCHMMRRSRPYILSGRVDEDFGVVSLTVDSVRLL
jgi:DNA polymerase III alpha subunit